MRTFLLIFLLSISGAIANPFEDWEEIPVPNDALVYDFEIDMQGNFWACSHGIFKSTDMGANWMQATNYLTQSGTEINMYEWEIKIDHLAVTNENILYAAGEDVRIFRNKEAGNNWERFRSINAASDLVSVDSIIYAVENDKLMVSEDSAQTWYTPESMEDIEVISLSKAVNGDLLIGTNNSFIIMERATGKYITKLLDYNFDSRVKAVQIFDNEYYCIIKYGTYTHGLVISTDYGATWSEEPLVLPFVEDIHDFKFGYDGKMYLGTNQRGLLISDDGGQSWINDNTFNRWPVFKIKFYDNKMYVATAGLYVSGDGGETWELINDGLCSSNVVSYEINSKSEHYCFTNYNIYKSMNGTDWERVNIPDSLNTMKSYIFDKSGNLYVVITRPGFLFKSTDGGETWDYFSDLIQVMDIDINSEGSIFFNEDIYGATIYKSNNEMASWDPIRGINSFKKIIIANNDDMVVVSDKNNVEVSYDKGTTWKPANLNKFDVTSVNAFDSDENRSYLGIDYSGFVVSTNKGNTWEKWNDGLEHNNAQIEAMNDFAFAHDKLFAATNFGVYMSADSGQHWEAVIPESTLDFNFITYQNNYMYTASVTKLYKSQQTVSVETEDSFAENMGIYPNPAESSAAIMLNLPEAKQGSIKIYDQLGNIIANVADGYVPGGQNKYDINLSGYSAGIYYCVFSSGSGSITKKIIKMR